jgi:predicted amidophosphoribosyltransferase
MRREERRAIVAGAFAARPERVSGHRLLLVDDVITTGATLDACTSALLVAGARSVHCVTWARAD